MYRVVKGSWDRCRGYGLEREGEFRPSVLPLEEVTSRRRAAAALVRQFEETAHRLEEPIGREFWLLALADGDGCVLAVHGTASSLGRGRELGLGVGTLWDEAHAGNNGIGTALAEDSPVGLAGEDHYRVALIPVSWAACPIRKPGGGAAGVLTLVADGDAALPYTGPVTLCARSMEVHLQARPNANLERHAPGTVTEEFFARMAHELRNPLATIRGFAQLLPGAGQDRARTYADTIVREVDRINALLTELTGEYAPDSAGEG